MRLSIVIVSYNVRYYLEQCLRSVFASRVEGGLEVFVVDNASSDQSIAYLKPLFPEVTYIQNHENVGFSRANNQALRLAKGEYVLLLNPDTILTDHTLQDCLTFLDQHPKAGATGVAMYSHSGKFAWESRRGLPTPWTAFCKMSGLGALFPHSTLFGRYYMRYLPRLEASRIEVISGAFCMIRRKALDEVGLLDEDFFMYGEDIDLSFRLLKGGWENYYHPTPILHYKGESTQKSSYRYVHIFYEAMLIFFNKHYRHQYRLFALLLPLIVKTRAGIDLLQRYLKARTPKRETDWEADMTHYTVRSYGTMTYTQMIEERVKAYEHGDRRSLGVRYTESGITVLPNDILR
ncbi:MAG: glycosyltransferase family 2 protein [Prevotellaceae bacterium]|nr:glycosyltransferase family 2 protein [Prevotellaceae bacterium]